MTDDLLKAERAKSLLTDPVLQEAMSVLKDDCVGVFSNPNASQEEIMEAHRMVRALGALETQLQSFVTTGRLIERRKKR